VRLSASEAHFGLVADDAVQPSGEFRAALKLAQMSERREQAVLEKIFRVLRGANQSSGGLRQFGNAGGKKVVDFGWLNLSRQERRNPRQFTGNYDRFAWHSAPPVGLSFDEPHEVWEQGRFHFGGVRKLLASTAAVLQFCCKRRGFWARGSLHFDCQTLWVGGQTQRGN
jgi:hypothetical protein